MEAGRRVEERFAVGGAPSAALGQHRVNGRRPNLALTNGKFTPFEVPQIIHPDAFARQKIGVGDLRSIPCIGLFAGSVLGGARSIDGNPGLRAAETLRLGIDGSFVYLRIVDLVEANASHVALADGIQTLVVVHQLADRINIFLRPR